MSVFNEPIDPFLVTQLGIRQDLLGKQDRNSIELSFLNSNTSWVKLQSSVNINKSPDAAKNNILFGGLTSVTENNALRVPAGLSTGTETINTGFSYNLQTSESENNVLGLRPMPGITSVNIENIGAYGSTRKATVNFQCWDVKQLEILEALYMRPGYTVLLEFGRTNYIKSDSSKLVEIYPRADFFNENITNLHDYLSELYRESLKQGGHYDAFFGYVINFKWSANNSGGYNCMTEILSTGEVVESLKLNYSYGGAIKYDTLNATTDDAKGAQFQGLILKQGAKGTKGIAPIDIIKINNKYSENILSGLVYELYTTFRYESTGNFYTLSTTPSGTSPIKITSPSGKPISVDWARINYESYADEPKDNNPDRFLEGNQDYYITLESFCELVNAFIVPQAYGDGFSTSKGSLTGISTKGRTYTKKPNTSPEQLLCLYNSLLISTNPDVCWIKNDNWTNIISNTGVAVDTTPVAPKFYTNKYVTEPWSKDLRDVIQGLLNDMFDKDVDHEIIEQNIENTYNSFKNKSAFIVDEPGFYKAFQANFQIIRGGIINNKRNWDGFTAGTARSKNLLQNPFPSVSDSFWELYKYNYPSARLPLISDVEKLLKKYTNEFAVDKKLDGEIQKLAPQVAIVQKSAETVAEASTNLVTIADNFKKLKFDLDFKYDKKTKGGTSLSDFGVIGNIYVNLKHLYLLSKSQTSLSSDPSGKNIISLGRYFDSLIHDIQTSLGNVNDFKIHIDPVDGIARIIDLNYINKDQSGGLFEFNIGTNNSIVRDLKLESYMSNDMMNMISISAQAAPGKMGYDNTTITTYNQGITDRNLPTKDVPLRVSDDGEAAVNFISNLGMLVNTYLKKLFLFDGTIIKDRNTEEISTTTTHPEYNANESNTYSNSLREIINFLAANSNFTSDNAGKSLLATEISLTLDGLSGFVIGNLFKVDNTFIPKYYKNTYQEMGYTITGVSHELSNNDWTTTIKAFPVDLGSNKVQSTNPKKFSTIYINPGPPGGGGGGTGDGDGSTPGVVDTDCGSATVDLLPLLNQLGIPRVGNPGETNFVTPQLYNDLKNHILPFMQRNSKSLVVTSINRPGDPGKHGSGNGIDFQINGISGTGVKNQWSGKSFSNWKAWTSDRVDNRTKEFNNLTENKSHPYTQAQLDAINKVQTGILKEFSPSGETLDGAYYEGVVIGSSKYRFLNENYTPSRKNVKGPHFHFQRQCGRNVDPNVKLTSKPKGQSPTKKTPPLQPKTNTPVPESSTTPPGTTSTIATAPVVTPTIPTPSSTPPTPSQSKPIPTPPPVTPPVPSPTIMAAPPKKSTIKFPIFVQVNYVVDGSKTNIVDEMHSFDSTSILQPGGKRKIYIIGNGNQLVMDELKKLYDLGFKPIVNDVKLTVESLENTVTMKWSVSIVESTDGMAYTGFTSRGSASAKGPVPLINITGDPTKNITAIYSAVDAKYKYTPKNVKIVGPEEGVTYDDSTFRGGGKGTRHIRQIFYAYTDQNPEGVKPE
jgi:hypothetical protein